MFSLIPILTIKFFPFYYYYYYYYSRITHILPTISIYVLFNISVVAVIIVSWFLFVLSTQYIAGNRN